MIRTCAAVLPLLLLAACGSGGEEQQAEAAPAKKAAAAKAAPAKGKGPAKDGEDVTDATPNAERVATIGVLNKRNNLTTDLVMKPGEARRFGKAVVRVQTCERTPDWEPVPETGAFVQVYIEQRAKAGDDETLQKVFSGWLFKNSPSLNVVEHPVYDVWVKNCAMRYPGEGPPPGSEPVDKDDGKEGGAAPAKPAPKPAPKPDPKPESSSPKAAPSETADSPGA